MNCSLANLQIDARTDGRSTKIIHSSSVGDFSMLQDQSPAVHSPTYSERTILGSSKLGRLHRLRALLAVGCLHLAGASVALSQTFNPSVYSANLDPASLGGRNISDGFPESSSGWVVPAAHTGVTRVADDPISLGTGSHEKILSITEGEDKLISSSDTPPDGYPVSTNAQMGRGYLGGPTMGGGYTPGGNFGVGGAYSGSAPYGSPTGNPCCPENCHDYYVKSEAVFLRRKTDQRFSLSAGNYVRDDFDFELGGRFTIGQMLDCTDGVELVYTGPFKWRRGQQFTAQTTLLDSIFTTSGGYPSSAVSTFNNALRHIQFEEIDLQSYEANRRWFAWDILSTLIGIRALQYNESLLFDSVGPAPDFFAGFYRQRMENFLLGAQAGADITRPVGQRLSLGTYGRLGIFANFNRGETILTNAGSVLINSRHRDVDIAGLAQYGGIARYRLTRSIALHAGYEAWVLAGVGTSSDQRHTPITPLHGTDYRAQDLVLLHGATGGIEAYF
jgi:hypothetical protein